MHNNQKLKGWEGPTSFAEIMQAKRVRFAFTHREDDVHLTQLHGWCLCRDFLSDVVVEHHQKGLLEMPIYGFDCSGINLDNDKTRLMMNYAHGFQNLIDHLHIINELETHCGWECTQVSEVSDSVLLLEGDVRWQSASIYISLYSLLLRGLCFTPLDTQLATPKEFFNYLEVNVPSVNECRYLKTLAVDGLNIPSLLKGQSEILSGKNPIGYRYYRKLLRVTPHQRVHDSLGIRNFAKYGVPSIRSKGRSLSVGRQWGNSYLSYIKKESPSSYEWGMSA